MFQFPGFALQTLCIQVRSTWFTQLLITRGDNNRISGGLPHSEILGSKPILGSPKLIAEYHVLHRLLLPRHPPNALFALDLIQKEQRSFYEIGPFVRPISIKSILYSLILRRRSKRLVYLTWKQNYFEA